jgi:aminoglycoside phosphotransferase (APT) family kinase protein
VLGDELLDVVRVETGCAGLEYARVPVRLSGGFFTENLAFSVAGAPAPWDGPLVVRLFPSEAPDDLARREATVQRVLAAHGYPAPAVVWFDDTARISDRRCFVMRRLPGQPMVGGIKPRDLLTSGRTILRRLVETTASAQAWLHRIDAQLLVEQLGDVPVGVERWFEHLAQFERLAEGRDWLVAHRPRETARPVICHGDLHPGNMLVEGDLLTGVLDYTVTTIAEPALDVGYTAMSLHVAPIDAPAPVQRVAARIARRISDRYVAAYRRQSGADLTNQPYYEALRCASELTNVVSYRVSQATGTHQDAPRPTWDSVAPQMVEYFRERTGVTLVLPPPPGRDRARGR